MRIRHLMAAAAVVIAAGNTEAPAHNTSGHLGTSVDLRDEVLDSFIFVFTDDAPASKVGRPANALARANGGRITHVYTTALRGFAAKMLAEAA